MYVKIWSIKSNTRQGGSRGLAQSLDYIKDEAKMLSEEELDFDESIVSGEENVQRSLDYAMNGVKTNEHKLVSGYLCDPDFAVEQFVAIKEQNMARVGKTADDDEGVFAYHIVQSFPKDLDISDEEVHQCGLELCQKLGLFQAVVCSHVSSVIDDDGIEHGAQKHNHIIINSHCFDPEKQYGDIKKMKYLDNKETYALLRVYNDEIAKAHGLPIIENSSKNGYRSWLEQDSIKKGTSWKQLIKKDIDKYKIESKNWDELKDKLIEQGYEIKEGKYTSYKLPDQERFVRSKSLGEKYSEEALEQYFEDRDKIIDEIEKEEQGIHDFYMNKLRVNSKSKKPYKISLYDAEGRKRSKTELILMLAMVIMNKEGTKYYKEKYTEENNYGAKPAYKIQAMANAIKIAREENVKTPDSVDNRLKDIGIKIARDKSRMKKIDIALSNVDILYNHLKTYEELKDKSNKIEEEQQQLKEAIAYINNKPDRAVLLTDKDEYDKFMAKREELLNGVEEVNNNIDQLNEEYRNFRKLKHQLDMADNDLYCYGPEYVKEAQEPFFTKERAEIIKEAKKEEGKDDENNKNNPIIR